MKSGCRVRLCVRPAGTKGPGNRSVCKATCAKGPPGAQHPEGALSIQTRVAGSCVYPTPVLSWEDWKVPSSGLGTLYPFFQISKLDVMQGSQGDPSTTDEDTTGWGTVVGLAKVTSNKVQSKDLNLFIWI